MEWKASHILVKQQDLAKRIYQLIREKKDFKALAKEYSTCPSKSKGGDLGWFGPSQMVRPFEEAVKKMSVGSVKGPVKTQFGYHIIKLTGRR